MTDPEGKSMKRKPCCVRAVEAAARRRGKACVDGEIVKCPTCKRAWQHICREYQACQWVALVPVSMHFIQKRRPLPCS